MTMMRWLVSTIVALLFVWDTGTCTDAVESRKNVILIIADDLGIRDLGCYQATTDNKTRSFYETPYIDQLASEGILFENAYSADATCPRSRAGIFTGIHPSRLGVVDMNGLTRRGFPQEQSCLATYTNPSNDQFVPLEATTLPEAFQQHNYRTALIGKWHSGNATAGSPSDHGFDVVIGNATGGLMTHFYPYTCKQQTSSTCHLDSRGKPKVVPFNMTTRVPNGTISTHHLTLEAIQFLKEFQSDPFFLVLSHYAVHTPIESLPTDLSYFQTKRRNVLPPQDLDRYEQIDGLYERQTQDVPEYAGLVKALDDSIGILMSALRGLGLAKDTIIMFTSDNGGKAANNDWIKAQKSPTSNFPFKQGKEYLGDGGVRVPLLVKPPTEDGAKLAGRRINYRSLGTDIFPTLLDMAGLPLYPNDHFDGQSLLPVIMSNSSSSSTNTSTNVSSNNTTTAFLQQQRVEPLFWQDPKECFINASCSDTSMAILWNDWKLIKRIYFSKDDYDNALKNDGNATYREMTERYTLELYNLLLDPGERQDQSKKNTTTTNILHHKLQEWERNWFHSPYYDRLMTYYGCHNTQGNLSVFVPIEIPNNSFEREGRWKVVMGNPHRDCDSGEAHYRDCHYVFVGGVDGSDYQRIRYNVEGLQGNVGSVYHIRYWLKGEMMHSRNHFKVYIRTRQVDGDGNVSDGQLYSCMESIVQEFDYQQMDCTFQTTEEFDIMNIQFSYFGNTGTVYLDKVTLFHETYL